MTITEIDILLEDMEACLMEASTLQDWDEMVHKYNAMKIKRCQMTGEKVITDNCGTEYKQFINIRK